MDKKQLDAFKRLLETLDTAEQAKAAGAFIMLLPDNHRSELWTDCERIIEAAVAREKAY